MPSISRRLSPLSITWVSPRSRGLRERAGRSRNPSEPSNEGLQSLLRVFLHVVEERVAVRVDADPEWAEVLDAELPEALGHELLPRDLLDLLDLRRLERRRPADEREIDHPVTAHGLDRLVGHAALAGDGPHAVGRAQALGKANHARTRRRADRHLLVPAGADLAYAGSGVQQEGAAEVHGRLDALVEDA